MVWQPVLATAFALALCGSAAAAELHEAPSLAALVTKGSLPPVARRVPTAPDVVKPTASVGRYGGVLRTAFRGDADQNAILRIVGNQGLTRWTPDYENVVPNVAESWTRSDDASEYTFKLRPGMKWSDGQPFTADDITFFVNDLLPDPQFFSSPPAQYVINGKAMRAEKIDDTTVKLIFAGPYLGFPRVLATPLGQHPVLYEKHYCEQFMPKYNPNIAALLKQSGQPDWPTLFRQKCGDIEIPSRWSNLDRPTLDPWIISTPYSGNATQVVLQRNPYFWETDTAGNQLPYIDTVNMKVISDVQSIVLAAIGGQLDLQVRHINTIGNKPVLAQHADQGGYVLETLTPTDANAEALFLNQTDKNPKLRQLLTNHDFREALSLGVDRDEINDIVFLGQTKPWQVGPLPADRFYNKELATQYTTRNVDAANKLLDGLGLTKHDGDGFREYQDGSKVFLTADVMVLDPASIDTIQLIKKHWADIGIDVGINTEERSLFYNRGQNNDYDIDVMPVPGGLDPTSDPRGWLSTHTLDSRQSLPWVAWYQSGGHSGERPSDNMVQRLALWDQWKQATTPDQADGLFRQILQLAAASFDVIGTEQGLTTFGIHSKKLMNVPNSMPSSWNYANPGPTLLQQYYFAP
ncbi:MAG TPA: ABC transporter substrate-binding protein [Acetobacteraceae bacterium]|jgi:peptide/nickel transport system substrate-binding protein